MIQIFIPSMTELCSKAINQKKLNIVWRSASLAIFSMAYIVQDTKNLEIVDTWGIHATHSRNYSAIGEVKSSFQTSSRCMNSNFGWAHNCSSVQFICIVRATRCSATLQYPPTDTRSYGNCRNSNALALHKGSTPCTAKICWWMSSRSCILYNLSASFNATTSQLIRHPLFDAVRSFWIVDFCKLESFACISWKKYCAVPLNPLYHHVYMAYDTSLA